MRAPLFLLLGINLADGSPTQNRTTLPPELVERLLRGANNQETGYGAHVRP